MRIAVVSASHTPFIPPPRAAVSLADLTTAWVRLGHDVRVVLPFPPGLDVAHHALARRLVPLSYVHAGNAGACQRWDGKTSGGVNICLIDDAAFSPLFDGGSRESVSLGAATFTVAAATLLDGLAQAPELIVAWGPATAEIPRTQRRGDRERIQGIPVIGVLPGCDEATPTLIESWRELRPVVAFGGAAAEPLLEADQAVDDLVASGRLTLIAPPAATRPALPVSRLSKQDQRLSLCLLLGLPVRTEAPLIAMDDVDDPWVRSMLEEALSHDVAVVVPQTARQQLSEWAGRYPDRLAFLPRTDDEAVLLAANGFVARRDHVGIGEALACGALPVLPPGSVAPLSELSLRGDSGEVLQGAGAHATRDAVGRLIAIASNAQTYDRLLHRLVARSSQPADVARKMLQLVLPASL